MKRFYDLTDCRQYTTQKCRLVWVSIMSTLLIEKIFRELQNDITMGKLAPSEKLVESKLASLFQTSRSPLREALRKLESEGLITGERNKGFTVSKLSIQEVGEFYELRWLLEGHAAGLYAANAKKSEMRVLRRYQQKWKEAIKADDLKARFINNNLFHQFLSEHSGNTNLHRILENVKRRVYRYTYITMSREGPSENFIEQHEGIIEACERNDCKMAEKFMRSHIETMKKTLNDFLETFVLEF